MQSVTFNRRPGVGEGHLPEETLPLDRFLYQLPHLLLHTVPRPPFPPLSILNEILRGGIEDAGMSGGVRWLPFEIDARDYVEAVAALRARDGYTLESPPDWVRSVRDWEAWKLEAFLGDQHARERLQHALQRPVRTSADDDLMRIAKAYSDAQRMQDEQALRDAEESLQAFLIQHHLGP